MQSHSLFTVRLGLVILAGCLTAACLSATAEPQTLGAATAPAVGSLALDPQVEALLTKIEARARATSSLKADIVFTVTQGLVGDVQKRTGTLTFVAGPPAGYAAHFTSVQTGKTVHPQNRSYIFDGVNMVERIDEPSIDVATGQPTQIKEFVKIQLPPAPPGSPAADPLASGTGPFPLPINMRKDIVARNFTVTLVPATAPAAPESKDEPDNSVHLKLTPKPAAGRVEFTEMHLWYDKDQFWPVRVRTYDSASEKETLVDLKNHKINDPVDKAAISTATPTDPGWEVRVEPWKPGK